MLHLLKMLIFFQTSADYLHCDEDALAQSGDAAHEHAAVHRRIVRQAIYSGLFGLLVGIATSLTAGWSELGRGDNPIALIVAPFFIAAGGMLVGVSMACITAPRSFLEGPVGAKWMDLIGTRNVNVARIVCLLLTVLLLAPILVLGIAVCVS